MDSRRNNSKEGHFAALEELSKHDPIFYAPEMNGKRARPASSQRASTMAFSVQSRFDYHNHRYNYLLMQKTCIYRMQEAKEQKNFPISKRQENKY
jgi:hypothetical protein